MKKSFRKVVIASAVILSAMAFQPHEVKAFDFGGGFSSSSFGSSFSASDYAPISSNSSSSSSLSNISTSDYRPISTPSVSESVSNVSSSDYRPISTPSVSESVSNVSSSDYRPISTPSISESVSSVSSSDYRPISTPSVSESVNNVSSSDYRPISTPSVSESVSNVSSSDYQPISTPSVSESASDVSSSDYRPISTPSVSEDASNIKPSDYKPISDSSVSASDSLADSVDYKAIAGKDDTVTTDSLAKKGKDDALKMADSKVDQSTTDALDAVDFTEKALESANTGAQKSSTGSSRYNLAVSPEVETALDSLSEEHRNQFIKALKDYGYGLNNSETSATTTPEYTLSSTSSSNKGKLDFTPYGQSTLTDSQGQPTSAYQDLLDLANSKESQPLFNQSASNDYQIKKGDSLAKIGNLHYPDDKEKAAAASMLALQDLHGQNKLNINNKQNRINLTPGDKVNVDLSNYTSEEISALAKGFNKIQSAENKIDTFRQAQEEAKALARAQERQNRAFQARKIWQEQPTNATSKLSDLLQQNTDSASESKSQKIAKGWANLSAPTKPNRFGQPNYQAAYQEAKIRPTTLEEVRPGALSQFVNKYLLADPSASNKYLAETKVSPKDFSLDAFEKRSKISHEAGKAAFKEYYNDAVTGLASLADLSFDGMKTTAHKAGLVNLSKDELNEIYNRDSAVWQGIIDKWDSTSAPEMLLGVSRYVMNLASQLSPGSREINSISNFMAGDGLAQKNQLKTTLEAAEFALPASKASIAGKIAKNGVGSAAHAIASKTGKVLNTAEGFGKNLFDATKSKVDNFEQKGHQSALTEKVLNNIADSANARRASNFYPHIGKEKRIDTHRYDLWNRYVNEGLEPSDRAKLTQWSQLLEPEFYLENKKVFDNPDYFNQLTGNAIYPGTPESALGRVDGSIHKDGFLNGEYKESVILPGTRINRIGSNPTGRYFSPAGATFGEKALPPFMKLQPNADYISLKEIPIKEGLVAPWFDEPGMGIQYYTYLPTSELEKGGYLHKIKRE